MQEEEAKRAREEEARRTQMAEEEKNKAARLRKVCTPDRVLVLEFPQSGPGWEEHRPGMPCSKYVNCTLGCRIPVEGALAVV